MNQRVIGFTRRQRISIGTEVFPDQVFGMTSKGIEEFRKKFPGLACDLTPNYVGLTLFNGPCTPQRQVRTLRIGGCPDCFVEGSGLKRSHYITNPDCKLCGGTARTVL